MVLNKKQMLLLVLVLGLPQPPMLARQQEIKIAKASIPQEVAAMNAPEQEVAVAAGNHGIP
jgi:hypothetical protein